METAIVVVNAPVAARMGRFIGSAGEEVTIVRRLSLRDASRHAQWE